MFQNAESKNNSHSGQCLSKISLANCFQNFKFKIFNSFELINDSAKKYLPHASNASKFICYHQ
ncbi:hypothetical protein T10_3958 [Trichinella papuae]|uniref:Uncharacterized protein n=1 Tax=Trichinella papuae TaxID=268474 RepID=A0A0V1N3S9_9BILA|nr:hypothetical protein T10_3958 [Trichinella papuae]